MGNWSGTKSRQVKEALLSHLPGSPRPQSLKTNLQNKKYIVAAVGLATALFGFWGWQALAANGAPVAGVALPANTDNQSNLEIHNQATVPSDASASAGSASNSSNTDVNINVNGHQVSTPESGSVHKVIHDDNGTTTIDVNVQSHGSGNDSSLNSDIDINSHSDGGSMQQ